ncbi:MAG: FtsX-like permease family protein [Moorea sp. SIO2B7]|nr:FtsX-like permease family protein [Moorena sp. SIO2B7]
MKLFTKIPLAWLQLTRNKIRLLVALMGIAFAAILIFMQLAFLDSLYDSQTALHQRLKADLVLINSKMKTLASTRDFPRQYLYRTLNFPEVASINYIHHGQFRLRYGKGGGGKGIVTLGINPANSPFEIPGFERIALQLNAIGTVIFDRNSDQKEYGNIANELAEGEPISAELRGQKVWIAGMVDFAGASFADDGNLITSVATFLRIDPSKSSDGITIGIINLKQNVELSGAIEKLRTQLPTHLLLMTKQEFIDYEKHYWVTSAPIGFVFSMGVFVGFFVGVIIVYQILYSEVSEHLSDYAVLKARGFKHRYFLGVLFQEALLLAIMGYIPGLAITLGLYEITRNATALPMYMTFKRVIFVLLLTIIMCFTSGVISMNKLKEADPADLL